MKASSSSDGHCSNAFEKRFHLPLRILPSHHAMHQEPAKAQEEGPFPRPGHILTQGSQLSMFAPADQASPSSTVPLQHLS